MIVSCKMQQCPFNDKKGFCAKPTVVGIDQNGMCEVLWWNGRRKQLSQPVTEELYPKEPITIITLGYKAKEDEVEQISKVDEENTDKIIETKDSEKEKKEGEAESQSEAPIDDTAAHDNDSI